MEIGLFTEFQCAPGMDEAQAFERVRVNMSIPSDSDEIVRAFEPDIATGEDGLDAGVAQLVAERR